jgi:hypothetical protein
MSSFTNIYPKYTTTQNYARPSIYQRPLNLKNINLQPPSLLKQNIFIFLVPLLLVLSGYILSLFFLKIKNISQESKCIDAKEQKMMMYLTLGINVIAILVMIVFVLKSLKLWKTHKFIVCLLIICLLVTIGSTITCGMIVSKIDSSKSPTENCLDDKYVLMGKMGCLLSIVSGNIFVIGLYLVSLKC